MKRVGKQLLIGVCVMALMVPMSFARTGVSVHLGPASYSYHDRGGPAIHFGLHYNTAPYQHHSRYHYRPYHYYHPYNAYKHHTVYKPHRTYYHQHDRKTHRPYGHYNRPFYGRQYDNRYR